MSKNVYNYPNSIFVYESDMNIYFLHNRYNGKKEIVYAKYTPGYSEIKQPHKLEIKEALETINTVNLLRFFF